MKRDESYRELFERSPNAILIIEGDQFVDCNPAAVELLRYPSKEALLERAHPADISPPFQHDGRASREKAQENLALVFERGSHTFEWTHLCVDGEPILVEVQLTVVRREPQPVIHVVWRDLRERKRLEAELGRAQRLEAVGRLAGGVAHDFNNLLVVIMGHAELLKERLKPDDADPTHLSEIQRAAQSAASLTRQLLAFSRGQPAKVQATDMGGLVEDMLALLRRLIGEHISLSFKQGESSSTVVADRSQLEQLVVNLVTNARDAMTDGGQIRIEIDRREVGNSPDGLAAGSYVELCVVDSGSGMTGEQLDRAFEPFFTTKEPGRGTGLGLATVSAIVQQYGGHASIESDSGLGTKVSVLLPWSPREAIPLDSSAERPATAPTGLETILLVEDEPSIRHLFEESLTAAGYSVVAAQDGRAAVARADELGTSLDLLVTDVVIPHLSGPDVVRELRPRFPALKVIFMSGYTGDGNLNLGPDDDSSAVLHKPFAPKRLLFEVRKMLDRAQ